MTRLGVFAATMTRLGVFAALLLASASATPVAGADRVVACYYGSWAVYRVGDGLMNPENIDPKACTHVIYTFAKLGADNSLQPADAWADLCDGGGKCGYEKFNELKTPNPKLVTLLSVGGFNAGSAIYSQMANDPAKRQTFINSSVALLQKYKFDGLDVNWEYPGSRGGAPYDGANYITLLKEMRAAFTASKLQLTVTVPAVKSLIDAGYTDGSAIAAATDFVFLMTYGYHGSWEHFTNHQSLLYAYPEHNDMLNQNYSVNYWMDKGVPADKLVMILPAMGNCWTLANPANHSMYASAPTPSAGGPLIHQPGTLGYNEICEIGKSNAWTVVHDKNMNEPYAYNTAYKNAWCGYEDTTSMTLKTKWAAKMGLAGVAVWSIDMDDLHKNCGGASLPLVKAVREAL